MKIKVPLRTCGAGCTHSQFTVEAGKTYRLRIINAATLVFMTVCFDAHNVTIIAADAVPTAPYTTRCVDVNSGQRWAGVGGSGGGARVGWGPN